MITLILTSLIFIIPSTPKSVTVHAENDSLIIEQIEYYISRLEMPYSDSTENRLTIFHVRNRLDGLLPEYYSQITDYDFFIEYETFINTWVIYDYNMSFAEAKRELANGFPDDLVDFYNEYATHSTSLQKQLFEGSAELIQLFNDYMNDPQLTLLNAQLQKEYRLLLSSFHLDYYQGRLINFDYENLREFIVDHPVDSFGLTQQEIEKYNYWMNLEDSIIQYNQLIELESKRKEKDYEHLGEHLILMRTLFNSLPNELKEYYGSNYYLLVQAESDYEHLSIQEPLNIDTWLAMTVATIAAVIFVLLLVVRNPIRTLLLSPFILISKLIK